MASDLSIEGVSVVVSNVNTVSLLTSRRCMMKCVGSNVK